MNINVQRYLDTIKAPWGMLFYKLVWHNLECKDKKIIDFGSGFGVTANHMAQCNAVTAVNRRVWDKLEIKRAALS